MSRLDSTSKRAQITHTYVINSTTEDLVQQHKVSIYPREKIAILKNNTGITSSVNRHKLKTASHNITTGELILFENQDYIPYSPGVYIVCSIIEGCGMGETTYSMKSCSEIGSPELEQFHNTSFKPKTVGKYSVLVHEQPHIPNTVYNMRARYNCLTYHSKNIKVLGPHRRLNLALLPGFEKLHVLIPNTYLSHFIKCELRYKLLEPGLYTNVYSRSELVSLLEGMVEPQFLQRVVAKSCLQIAELDKYMHFGAYCVLIPSGNVIFISISDLATMAIKRSLRLCNSE